jgi:HSP20 family protein
MLITNNIKHSPIYSTVKAQLRSPATYPIMGHMVREFSRRGRYFSSTLNTTKKSQKSPTKVFDHHLSTNAMLTPLAPTGPSFLKDFGSDFFQSPSSLMNSSFVMPFLKQMEWMDDMRRKSYFPSTSITKTEDNKHILSMEIPGMTMDEVNVEVNDDKVLHISGEKKTKDAGEMKEMKFDQKFAFGDTVDTKNIIANLKDGVLRVTLPQIPKSELPPEKVRKIKIAANVE